MSFDMDAASLGETSKCRKTTKYAAFAATSGDHGFHNQRSAPYVIDTNFVK